MPIARDQWFRALFGFAESEALRPSGRSELHERLTLQADGRLVSNVNGLSYHAGRFSTPSLAELRDAASSVGMLTEAGAAATIKGHSSLILEHVATRDIFELHSREEYAGATFMAASQFNCLEFPHPDVTPEQGVTDYFLDMTQGPACALAAPAATVVRNYFVPTNGRVGQTADNQLNNLAELLASLRPTADEGDLAAEDLVRVRNGYTSSDEASLTALNRRIASAPSRDALLGRLRIGLHENVEVPWGPRRFDFIEAASRQRVSQTFCSALSCGYSDGSAQSWAPLAQIVLDASYEATLWAAALEAQRGEGSGQVLLTSLGGGVFNNPQPWIEGAIARACARLHAVGLQVILCHHGRVDQAIVERLDAAIRELRAGEGAVSSL